MNLPSKFKFFVFSSGISGFILFIYGVSTLPQSNTSYYSEGQGQGNSINSNSGQTRESFDQQNRQMIISSTAFKEMLVGLGLCLLTIVAVVLYQRREARIEATLEEQQAEELKKKNTVVPQAVPQPVPQPVSQPALPPALPPVSVPLKPILKSTPLLLETSQQPLPRPLVVTRENVPQRQPLPVSYPGYPRYMTQRVPRPSIEYIQYKRT
jgi:hypothetical protein